MLDAGYPLSDVTEALCDRWQPGVRMLPMSDDRVETHVGRRGRRRHPRDPLPGVVGPSPGGAPDRPVRVRRRRDRQAGPGRAGGDRRRRRRAGRPEQPGRLASAPILAVPAIREAVAAGTAPVVGVSPIIGSAPVRGMADKCLAVIGVECSPAGVGRLYGARAAGGVLDGWLVDETDAGVEVPGLTVRARPLWMTDVPATSAIVRAALELAGAPGS